MRPKKGDRVQTRFGKGTCSDDYWRDRDRFTIAYDDGSESDHSAEAITVLVEAPRMTAPTPDAVEAMARVLASGAHDVAQSSGHLMRHGQVMLEAAAMLRALNTRVHPAPDEITMQDVRLMAGEGKLSAQTVLDACNATLRMRARNPAPEASAGGVIQADREAAADLMVNLFTDVAGFESDLDWSNTVRCGEDDEYPTVSAFMRHRLAHTPGFDAARDRAVEALGKAFRFIDGVAGQELSYTGKDGITLESQDICLELCAAFGVDLNEDWPAAALAAIQPQGERGEGVSC